MMRKSLNSFADHAPKNDWLVSFFDLKERFFAEHSLGPMMYCMFRRFLKDAGLNVRNHFTDFAQLISDIGWDTATALGLMLVNLAMENPQIAWYIETMDVGRYYSRGEIEERLLSLGVKPKDASSIVKAFKRIVVTPFGTVLNFGSVTEDYELIRTRCKIDDNRVILYAIYYFAEKCHIPEIHFSELYDEEAQREGVSPVRLFGLYDKDELSSIFLGLSYTYPEWLRVTHTGWDSIITLSQANNSQQVLNLF